MQPQMYNHKGKRNGALTITDIRTEPTSWPRFKMIYICTSLFQTSCPASGHHEESRTNIPENYDNRVISPLYHADKASNRFSHWQDVSDLHEEQDYIILVIYFKGSTFFQQHNT